MYLAQVAVLVTRLFGVSYTLRGVSYGSTRHQDFTDVLRSVNQSLGGWASFGGGRRDSVQSATWRLGRLAELAEALCGPSRCARSMAFLLT